jgi:nicotinamide-nucleotide amidase
LGGVELAFTVQLPEIFVTLTARAGDQAQAQAKLAAGRAQVEPILGDAIVSDDGRTMEEVVAALMNERRLTLALAESCTGGLLAGRCTNVPGSSDWFKEGVVVYSNEAKTRLLGVPADLIASHGAVSREVAEAMAVGARERAQTDLALAVTGVAGPSGGTAEKPVGTVHMALAHAGGIAHWQDRLFGDRVRVRAWAAENGLDRLRRHLRP